jgi:hypothetical protein
MWSNQQANQNKTNDGRQTQALDKGRREQGRAQQY